MDLSWQTLRELEEAHGDAFFLLDLAVFETNYREFLQAFRSHYAPSNIAYSYKTNYTPRLCQAVDALGGYAEVVSIMEYDLALRVGVAPSRIVFNGPCKSRADLERALAAGSVVNLDSVAEVALVEDIASTLSERMLTIGVRCNFDLMTSEISRFGFDVQGDEFRTAFERLNRLSNCRVAGLHCHFSTSDKTLESYGLRARTMLKLAAHWFTTMRPRFINLGGGFFSRMSPELRRQFTYPVFSYEDYAAVIAPQFRQAFPDAGPELILEPGTAITADIMRFVAKVVNVKTVRGRTLALCSGSIHNIKPTLHKKNLPLRIVSAHPNRTPEGHAGPADIVGYTCMEHDTLHTGYTGPLSAGDYVVFENVGAYTTVMKPPFIRPSPAILAHDPHMNDFQVIKRAEELADVFGTYVF